MSDKKRATPTVSIIIVNFNGLKHLNKCLSSVLKTEYSNFEIVLVDNGSSDGSVDYVKKNFAVERLKLIELPQNRGFAEGNNSGVKKARGKYIVLLNNDTEVDSEWLTPLVNTMESDAGIGAAQPKILLMNRRNRFDSAGNFINLIGSSYALGLLQVDKGQFDSTNEIFYAKGAAMITTKTLWEELGGLDPILFLSFEDTDFCWRIWRHGYRVVFVPASRIYHVGFASTSKVPEIKRFHDTKNRLMILLKNLDAKQLALYSPLIISSFMVEFLLSWLRRDGEARPILKGMGWVVLHFRKVWSRRVIARSQSEISSNDIMKKFLKAMPFLKRVETRTMYKTLKLGGII
ncbi:MAG: glycosyltransferase family 2 protein [Candidatus Atabeyarchaeum deiterrae]